MNKKITVQFVVLTFIIAYSIGGLLIFFGNYGYRVYNWVSTFQQFMMNVPFSIYILSPAIACILVLKHNYKLSVGEWLKTVFHFKNGVFSYLFVILGIVIYFSRLYNFMNDKIVAVSAVLMPLQSCLILCWFRCFSRKWHKIPASESAH